MPDNTLNLTVFANFTPDGEGGTYYFPKSKPASNQAFGAKLFEAFKTEAGADNYKTYSGNTFKLYGNYIDVGGVTFGTFQLLDITYAALSYNGYLTFYYVDNIQLVSSGVRLFIRPDNWATYIGGASLTKCEIFKTNLKFPNPFSPNEIIDSVYLADKKPYITRDLPYVKYELRGDLTNITLQDLCVYAVIQYQEEKTATEASENIHIFRFDPLTFVKSYYPDATTVTARDFNIMLDYIKTIYEHVASGGSAAVNKIYIFPNTLDIDFQGANRERVNFKGSGYIPYIPPTPQPEFITGSIIKAKSYLYRYYVNNAGNSTVPTTTTTTIIRNCIGGEIFFGSEFDGIKLPHFVGLYKTHFNVIVNEASIQFRVYAGSEIKDISSAFEVSFISNTSSLNEQEKTSKWLGVIANTAGGVAQIATGGITGAVSGALSLANTVNNLAINESGQYVAGGNAEITFQAILNETGTEFLYFCAFRTEVQNDGYINFQNNGGTVNISFKANLNDMLSQSEFLLTPNQADTNYYLPFIQARVQVDDIPYQACTDIANVFLTGVRLKYVEI